MFCATAICFANWEARVGFSGDNNITTPITVILIFESIEEENLTYKQ